MNKTQNAVTKNGKPTKEPKMNIKHLQQAENNYILANNDLVHKVINQDFSGRNLTNKDKKERKQYIDKFNNEIITMNTLYARYAYETLQTLLKKSKLDGIKITYFFDEKDNAVEMHYDYVLESGIVEEEIQYVHAENNELIENFMAKMSEHLESILIELSRKVLTEDGSLYFIKNSFEEFLEYFNINIAIGYSIEINLDQYNENLSESLE